jgi:hypothetical protein
LTAVADEPCDLVIEYSLDGEEWTHGKTVPAWVGGDSLMMSIQRAAVRENALAEHGEVGAVRTRVLREDDPRAAANQAPMEHDTCRTCRCAIYRRGGDWRHASTASVRCTPGGDSHAAPSGPAPAADLAGFIAGFTGQALVFRGSIPELLAAADEARLVTDAADAAAGFYPVAVVHGDPEPEHNARAMFEELPALAEQAGHVVSRIGGNDYSVYRFGGPGAAQAAEDFAAAAIGLADREQLT